MGSSPGIDEPANVVRVYCRLINQQPQWAPHLSLLGVTGLNSHDIGNVKENALSQLIHMRIS